MLGEENISNSNHNIVQNLLFSGIRFTDFREAMLVILSINVGIRPLDVIFIVSYILTMNKLETNRMREPSDFKTIFNLIT